MAESAESNSPPESDRRERVDGAHGVTPAKASQPETAGAPVAAGQGVAGHAEQLADWLNTQRAELGRRESLLSTQETDLEEKVQAAREWLEQERARLDAREAELEGLAADAVPSPAAEQALAERVRELDDRQARLHRETEALAEQRASFAARVDELDAREASLAAEEQRLAASRAELIDSERAIKERTESLEPERIELERLRAEANAAIEEQADRERRLELRSREIAAAVERYEQLGAAEERIAKLQSEALHAVEREKHLAEAESLLAEERAALGEAQRRLAERQMEHDARIARERRAWESDRAAWRAETKSTAETHARRDAELDRREESLRRLERELQATQREVLEMRLATEETWAQLTGLLTPAALSKSIAKVRVQLADHYRHTLDDINEARGALRDASDRVEYELRVLEQRQITIEEWAARRHDEIGKAAARVEGRENELNRQQRAFEQNEARWAAERSDYRDQIRQLRGELGREETPLARAA